jgi:hypothetical protein
VRRVPTFLAALAALLLVIPAAAQTPDATPAGDELAGLEYYAGRQYAPDPAAGIDRENPGLFQVSARVYVFDTEENADARWDSTIESTIVESDIPSGSDNVEFEEAEIDDLGDRAWVTTLAATTPEGDTGYFRLLYVQEGTSLYVVSAIAGSDDATAIGDDIAREIVEREPGDGEGTFREDGTSTGGIWDIFPATGDDVLDGIIAFADYEVTNP